MEQKSSRKVDELPGTLGPALRARRKELGLSMQMVARKAGLSVGFISQIERGLSSPSLSSLVNLAHVLQRPVGAFLKQPEAPGSTTRGHDRATWSITDTGLSYERISARFAGSQLCSLIVHMPPGNRTEPMSHHGEEMFFVLAGAMTVKVEDRADILQRGDSIHFDSQRTHSTWNHTDRTASILWCGTLDVFEDAAPPVHEAL